MLLAGLIGFKALGSREGGERGLLHREAGGYMELMDCGKGGRGGHFRWDRTGGRVRSLCVRHCLCATVGLLYG